MLKAKKKILLWNKAFKSVSYHKLCFSLKITKQCQTCSWPFHHTQKLHLSVPWLDKYRRIMHLFTCLETTSTVNAEWNAVCPPFWRAINEPVSYKQVPALCYPYSCYPTWILTSLVFSIQMTSHRQQSLVSISSCTASSIHISFQYEKNLESSSKNTPGPG